jgi:hypothetical protein
MNARATTALLEWIDRIAAEVEGLRGEVLRLDTDEKGVGNTDTPGGESGDDFAECNLIDCQSASQRFNYPADTLRKWARTENCGRKVAGRWLISIPRVHRRINGA